MSDTYNEGTEDEITVSTIGFGLGSPGLCVTINLYSDHLDLNADLIKRKIPITFKTFYMMVFYYIVCSMKVENDPRYELQKILESHDKSKQKEDKPQFDYFNLPSEVIDLPFGKLFLKDDCMQIYAEISKKEIQAQSEHLKNVVCMSLGANGSITEVKGNDASVASRTPIILTAHEINKSIKQVLTAKATSIELAKTIEQIKLMIKSIRTGPPIYGPGTCFYVDFPNKVSSLTVYRKLIGSIFGL